MPATTQQRSTVVGVFEDRSHANAAISELRQAGFREDQIGVASRHAEAGEAAETTTTGDGSHIGTGAIAGALAGAGLGGLLGLGIISGVIPALGLVIAGGTLAAILANVAGGAAIGGLLGALTGAGIPEEEAHYYQGEFEAGRTLVTVTADGRYDEAVTILRRHGAYD
ncbi:MAG: YsnF/AvaK domain-containing protein, partial [Isosphaeraceae bacterium]